MSMEKYGVEDVAAQQERELDQVSRRLTFLGKALFKTASDDEEFNRLSVRKTELETTIRSYKQ